MTAPDRVRHRAVGWAVAVLFWLYYLTPFLVPAPRPWHMPLVVGSAGLAAIAALALRNRSPLGCVLLIGGLLFISGASVGAAFVAQAAVAQRRGRSWIVLASGAWLALAKVGQLLVGPYSERWSIASAVELTVAVGGLAAATLIGWLVTSTAAESAWRDDAQAARRAAEHARLEQARLQERERIAREMHDVLAHRISLVAMHAGALVYRDDLDADAARDAARVIHGNAKQALDELRSVLSGLRDNRSEPEPPQPSLRELPVLVAEARSAQTPVTLDLTATGLDDLSPQLSRSAYRILQEGLTNARKHSPRAPVQVRIADAPDGALVLAVSNPLAAPVDPAASRAGLGLVGVAERVQLLGGTVTAGATDGRFELTVRIPRTTTP